MMDAEKDPDVVLVDADLYGKMVKTFDRVKMERYRNQQAAQKIDRAIRSIKHDMESFDTKIADLMLTTYHLTEAVEYVREDNTRNNLKSKIDSMSYSVVEMEGRAHKINREIKDLRDLLKPFKDYREGEMAKEDER